MPDLLTLYARVTRIAEPLLIRLLARRVRLGKEDPARLLERMGQPSRPRPKGDLVWIHAASVGEAQSALILVEALRQAKKDIHVLVTTGTVTSAALMQTRLPAFAFHQYVPLDHPAWIDSFLDYWNPDLVLWMESELWPNMLTGLKARKIPAILVNARLSEHSFRRWKIVQETALKILNCFSLILAQTPKDGNNFKQLGANHVAVTDNLKYSAASLPYDPATLSALKQATDGRPLWVYASTHAGEEDIACRVHKSLKNNIQNLLTIIVPRHPDRRNDISRICESHALKFHRRSDQALPAENDDLYIADTMGELGLFYTLCPVAMIGRSFSLDGGGGHNPVEAAQAGCAVITGPNNQFQRQIYDDMAAAQAVIEVKTEHELAETLKNLLTDKNKQTAYQEKAAAFAHQKTHVIDTVMEKIAPFLAELEKKHAA